MPFPFHGLKQLVIHLLSGNVFGNIHFRVSLGDDMLLGYAATQEFFLQHFKNGRLAAATNASQYLDKRLVDKRLNGLNIIRPIDHRIASRTVISITKIVFICNDFFESNLKSFSRYLLI